MALGLYRGGLCCFYRLEQPEGPEWVWGLELVHFNLDERVLEKGGGGELRFTCPSAVKLD